MKITRVGLDIAKQVFQMHGVDEQGKARVGRRLARGKVLEFFVQLPPCLIDWDRGVCQRTLLGPRAHQARAYGEADGSAVRDSVP